MPFDSMEFRLVGPADYELVLRHLRSSFFADEPLNKAVQLCAPGQGHKQLEKQCVDTMRDGYSIVAMEDGQVMGVALNGELRPGDTALALEKLQTLEDPKYQRIFTLLYGLTESLQLFESQNVDRLLECRIMSVAQEARGRGLAGELLRRSIQLAREQGYKIIKGDATGAFSQKMSENAGMQTVKELRYKEYVDPDTGAPVFDVPAPHETLKIMILRLDNN